MSKIAENASARIDEAIANAEPFAQPILKLLRKTILQSDKRLQEDWKWGPNFNLDGNICGIWGHKKHINFIFWKGAGMKDKNKLFTDADSPKALRTIKYTHVDQVNPKIVTSYVKEAIELSQSGKTIKPQRVPIQMPDILVQALEDEQRLKKYFDSLTYSNRKDFAHHIGEAKRAETRQRRLEKVLQLLRDKKGLHDKYK